MDEGNYYVSDYLPQTLVQRFITKHETETFYDNSYQETVKSFREGSISSNFRYSASSLR